MLEEICNFAPEFEREEAMRDHKRERNIGF